MNKNMKRFFRLAFLASVMMMASCADDFQYNSEDTTTDFGTLSFSDLQISINESESEVRSTTLPEADGNYLITIKDEEGNVAHECQYKDIKQTSEGISLQEGVYSLEVCSTDGDIPAAAWEAPIYGATKTGIVIQAGQTTSITDPIICTLLQCKVTVEYNDDFLKMVGGDCVTTVTVGDELEYPLTLADNGTITYKREAGYFAINGGDNTTMEVKFSGLIIDEESGQIKSMRQTKVFEGISARQWRQIKFVKKINEEGNATFEIEINQYVQDNPLGEDQAGSENVIGADPNAPKGDGDIRLLIQAGLNENTTPTYTTWNNSFTFGNPSFAPTGELGDG